MALQRQHIVKYILLCLVTLATYLLGHTSANVKTTFPFSILEGRPPGTFVGNLSTPTLPPIPTQIQGKFKVNHTTGVITSAVRLDREQKSRYEFDLVTMNHNIKVVINVLDVNDEDPIFEVNGNISISEAYNVGHQQYVGLLSDKDVGLNSIQPDTVRIVSGNSGGAFHLNITKQQGSTKYRLYLVLAVKLNRRIQEKYILNITASDKGNPVRTGYLQLTVLVEDFNDCPPKFLQTSYTAEVSENAQTQTVVLNVTTSDCDFGKNAEVKYEMDYSRDIGRYFKIKQIPSKGRFGFIQTNLPLDYELKKQYNLRVLAHDLGLKQKKSFVDVVVNVIDENDNTPRVGDFMFSKINEDAPVNALVATVEITDDDSGKNAKLNVTLQPDNIFYIRKDIHASSGRYFVYLKANLDREVQKSYKIIVTAIDNGKPPRKSQNAASLSIGDINDNPPKFDRDVYSINISESEHIGSSVLVVHATDPDTVSSKTLTYHIISAKNKNYSTWFTINSTSGQMNVASKLDREKFSNILLVVEVRDGGKPEYVANCTVHVYVLDVNDNAPEFSNLHYTPSVFENSPPGTFVLQLFAKDKDKSSTSHIVYMIDPSLPTDVFSLDNATGNISTLQSFDREAVDEYRFGVIATDEGGLTGKANVTVFIGDENDNRPFFQPDFYNLSVLENITIGSILIKLKAFDNDTGWNSEISYEIISGNHENTFALGQTNGDVSLQTSLDREKLSKYILKFRAIDNGGRTSLNMATVQIFVQDVNDDPPTFGRENYVFYVEENLEKPVFIGTVSAKSYDQGPGAVISYSIKTHQLQHQFYVNGSGAIFASTSLDRENIPSYRFTVEAQDYGYPPLFGYVNVSVIVEDVNDNAPVWPKSHITERVGENEPVGHLICTFHALDKDSGKNGEVNYSIVSGRRDVFDINPKTGVLSLLVSVDYELTHSFSLVVKASDLGTPSSSALVNVTILIEDYNDNKPALNDSTIYVDEDEPVNSTLFVFHAVDADSGDEGRIWYKLFRSDEDKYFVLKGTTGVLTLISPLDREKKAKHVLKVIAGDYGIPPKQTPIITFTIFVNDVNDETPTFTKRFTFTITENEDPGTFIGEVTATDSDLAQNSELSYRIINSTGEFEIDSKTGVLQSNVKLDREKVEHYSLLVEASDQGMPAKSNITTVDVFVQDVNDNVPIFTQEPYKVDISENTPKGTVIKHVKAIDQDKGANGRVVYYLNTGNTQGGVEVFQINHTTGAIFVVAALDRESKAYFVLSVVANDEGRPPRDAISKVFVTVLDVNDHIPAFKVRNDSVSIHEKTETGTLVYTANATDPDEGENGNIFYSIIGSSDTFRIDSKSGGIYLTKRLDYETIKQYTLQIQASDKGKKSSKGSILQLYINVIDSNDNSPYFLKNPIITTVTEGVPRGTKVHSPITAQDLDSGFNSRLIYSIISQQPKAAFKIDPFHAQLTTDIEIDREEVDEYTLVVKAIDQAADVAEQLSSTVTVKILVQDINDCYPEFTSLNSTYIMEDEPVNYHAFKFTATDKDLGNGGEVTFTITGGNANGIFQLDASEGDLILKKPIDREKVESYTLQVKASDLGSSPLSTTILFTVNVVDVNDNMPKFSRYRYEAFVEENQNETEVLQVLATDADSGNNGKLFYSIPAGIANDLFTIDETTGVISTTASLDREKEQTYQLTVYVIDNCYPNYTDSATVMIHVRDKNDNAPSFLKDALTTYFPENASPGFVCAVIAQDMDVGVNAKLVYSIQSGNTSLFTVDADNGILSTVVPLDREETAVHHLVLKVRDSGVPALSAFVDVTVIVRDKNDSPPNFTTSEVNVSVAKNSLPGTTVIYLRATDEDASSEVVYSFASEDEVPFGLDSTSGLIYTLNYLKDTSHYQFRVIATSRSEYNALNRTITVNIFIDNSMNVPLRFTKVLYEVDLYQTVPTVGDTILYLQLQNSNMRPGDVEYRSESGQSVLAVDLKTGNVSFTQKPDRGAYLCSVRATLVHDRSNTALCFVLVKVKESIARPEFLVPTYNVTLNESMPAGTPVMKLRPKTPGNVTFQLLNGNEYNAFAVSPSGDIYVSNASAIDYERTNGFELDVKGDWGNIVTNVAFVKVYINIRNVDDKPPVFRQNVFVAEIPESDETTDRRVVVKLYSLDFYHLARLYHIVSGNSGNVFSLSRHKGVLRLQKPVDREYRKLYNLTVSVGRGKLLSKCTVLVYILDINDNGPNIPKQFTFVVSENTRRGTRIGQITAKDKDDSSLLVYTFSNGNQQRGPFLIEPYTGYLILTDTIDFEKGPVKDTFAIVISDSKHSNQTSVTVTVLDYNDNKPQFQNPSYNIQPQAVVRANYTFGQVNATDKDSGSNGKITFSMTPADGVDIDPKTGVIYSTKELKYDPFRRFIDAVITASDGGRPSLSSKVPFRIRILDSANKPPKFANVSYNVNVSENAAVGTAVVTIKATDPDPTKSSKRRISYSILKHDGMATFTIEERTGILRVRGRLDRETFKRYNLVVQAQDSSDPKISHEITVRITVLDVNDNAPVFHPNKYYKTIGNESMYTTTAKEDAPNGSLVLYVDATDIDEGLNQEITYSISSGNDGGWFSIDKSGKLFLVSSLDRDVIPIHRLSVRATDQGDPSKASEISVVIKVNDINDNAPVFVEPRDLGLEENAPNGSFAGNVTATDSDTGKNKLIYYSIINGTGYGLFMIGNRSGQLHATTMFDYETKSSYTLLIKAQDQGSPPRSTVLETVVEIWSVDEYEPQFLNETYSFVVLGSAKEGNTVGRVQASDRDSGPDGIIKYELVLPAEPFAVNSTSGEIYLTEDFLAFKTRSKREKRDVAEDLEESETEDSYELIVRASSGKPGSKSSTITTSLAIDYTCLGCQPFEPSASTGGLISSTVLILIIALSIVGVFGGCFLIVCILLARRRKDRKTKQKGSVEAIGLQPVSDNPYGGKGLTNPYTHVPTDSLTNSQASAASSSGHGSSEIIPDVCHDVETMAANCYHIKPDSGVHIDFESENLSHGSDVENSESRSSDMRSDRTDRLISQLESRESLHEFDDEGGKEASGGVDVGNLLYAKLAEADAEEDDQNIDRPRIFKDEGRPDYTGSLSSILGSHEELRGHYNYFYTMNQGPQYQPLSEVFSEIGRLPVHKKALDGSTPDGETDMSGRTSLLSSVSSLHNQHLDGESTFSSLPITPNFTPAITPLVTRSPSLSPLTSEVVTPMVSPSPSRPPSMYLLRSPPSPSIVRLAEKTDDSEERYDDIKTYDA